MSDYEGARELHNSERNFRLLVEGITDYSIFMLDPTGIVTSWNSGAERIKGYTAHEIIGSHFSAFYTPEDRAAGLPQQALRQALTEGHFLSEGWRVRRDGSRFLASVVIDPIFENGVLVGFAKITRDITERNAALSKVEASEKLFQTLVHGVTDYALYMLSPTGVVENWNIGGQRIKGYLPHEIIGQHFSRFYTPEDRANDKPARALQIAVDTGHYEEDGWRVRKDGSYFWASVVIDPIFANDGSLIGFAKITRDITERKNAQDEIARVQQQLAEAQKLDALGHLTGGVAHDFNNLLMIITGNLHLLRKEVESEKGLRAFHSIQTATQRAGKLTKQLLTFARRQSVRPEAINLAKSLMGLGEVLNSALGANVALRFEISDDVGDIFADPGEFETALLNLVINARDAMPAGGDLTISAKNAKDGQVEIEVSDTGLGIPDDIAEKVFDPFFTTKSVGKGTGLGLSQVHGFAHQAGGDVILRSVLNRGTTFVIRLPRSGSCKKAEDEAYTSPSSGTVLLVEDHPDVAQATSNLLDLLGYTVRCANNASAALTELQQGGIDIVCSDIVMPGEMDGVELARVIRDSNPSLPILLLTGYSKSASDVMQQFPVLRKPYELHELSKALAAIRPH